jgi:asparagine synthase (glutamine-hydrolysing)
MCGLVGLTGPGARLWIRGMRDSLRHRGPDDAGLFFDQKVALGHRRLAIIDLSEDGRQPMAAGDLQLVFNGEIYNYKELRENLVAKGFQFQTQSDSEVLLHGYKAWGKDLPARLNGMFAFAIYDQSQQRLFLARDRCGQKPLYYTVFKDESGSRRLAFASEVRGLLACPLIPRQLDPISLVKFLGYEYLPAPNSMFKGIQKLPGGSFANFDLTNGSLQIGQFWTANYSQGSSSLDGAAEELRERLLESLKYRLQSDVPLGVFLSGGIDSSTLVGLLCRDLGRSNVKTFSIGFEEASFDESSHAKLVADYFGTEHHSEIFDEKQIFDCVPRVVEHLDEPFADPSILPTYLLSEMTRKHVTVALGGDGGDELFAGYDPFKAWSVSKLVRAFLPVAFLHTTVAALVNKWPVSEQNMSFEFRLKKLLRGCPYPAPYRHTAWLSAFEPKALRGLLSDGVLAQLRDGGRSDALSMEQTWSESLGAWNSAGASATELDRQIQVYMRTYLQEDILAKVDRASMAHSLEVRAPFLDPGVIDCAMGLKDNLKIRGFDTKVVLRHTMSTLLPKSILQRPKKGFGIPVSRWLRGPLKPWIEELLSESSINRAGLFRPATVKRLLDEHMSRKHDRRKELWALGMITAWARNYLRN